MVELFFYLASKWPKRCAQTLHPFSQILRAFGAPIVAPPNDDFSNLFPAREGLSSPKNAANIVNIGLEKPTLRLVEVIHYQFIPDKLRQAPTFNGFKRNLKTHLFSTAFTF